MNPKELMVTWLAVVLLSAVAVAIADKLGFKGVRKIVRG